MLAKYGRDPEAGPRVWPDRDPAENPDRLFLVQHEGQALDAIERFGDAPCVLPFTVVPCGGRRDDDLGVSARRPEQHGRPRRRRRLLALAGRGALRDAGGRAGRAGGRDRGPRGQRRAVPDPQALRRRLPRGPAGRRDRLRSGRRRRHELLEPPLEPRRRSLRQPRRADAARPRRAPGLAPAGDAVPGIRDRREERHAGDDLPPCPRPLRPGRPRRPPGRPSSRSSSANCRPASSTATPTGRRSATRSRSRPRACPTPPSPRAASPSVAEDDGLHYSTAGLLRIGERYAPALAVAEANTLAPPATELAEAGTRRPPASLDAAPPRPVEP